jgi:hypothetical protein
MNTLRGCSIDFLSGQTGGFAGGTGLGAVSWLLHAPMTRRGPIRVKRFVWVNLGMGDMLLSLAEGGIGLLQRAVVTFRVES